MLGLSWFWVVGATVLAELPSIVREMDVAMGFAPPDGDDAVAGALADASRVLKK